MRAVLGNRAFRVFIAGFALLWLGLSAVNVGAALFITTFMELPRSAVGWVLGVTVVIAMLTTPAVAALAHRAGTHRTLIAAMGVLTALLPFLAAIGLWPVPLGPAAQGYLVLALAGPALAALFTLPNALLADIAQAASAQGPRVEGMFFALQGLILNGATSVSSVLLGVSLQVFGYDLGLRLVPLVAATFVVAGITIFRRYPHAAGPATL
jgi:Na+/melibiose symporter-like transporter